MAHNSTGDETLFDPRMRKIIEWFGKITTPPDSRFAGFRHLPPIGNTWWLEPCGEFGVLARLWKDRDPDFSARMQWLWQQHRSWPSPGIGGSGQSTDGYRQILSDPALPAKAPTYGSELFPKTGAILRNVFPSDRETTLHLIAGPNHQHYDDDSGSITVWGKGRIVADDFGYDGCAPRSSHNMVETSTASELMQVQTFVSEPQLDYMRGVAGGWTRQIAFVKDADPLGPSYFLVSDSLAGRASGTWRLWLTAQGIELKAPLARVTGREDVDTDLHFLQPPDASLKTEEKTVSTFGFDPEGTQKWGVTVTQTAVVAPMAGGGAVSALIYPRLKTEAAPEIIALAGGKVAKVRHPKGEDYLFLSSEPFTFAEGDLKFSGTAGAVLRRGGKTLLCLPATGRLEAEGQSANKP